MPRTLSDLERVLGPEVAAARIAAADADAAGLEQVLDRIRQGSSRSAAVREVFPDRPVSSLLRRLREYEASGRDGLVSRRFPPPPPRKLTPEVMAGLRALAKTDPVVGHRMWTT